MSFGFSLGDFVAVIGLANQIRKVFVDAPIQFKDISQELRSLHIVLEDIEIILPGRELTSQQKVELHDIADGCRNVLKELEETLVKYEQIGEASDRFSKKVKRVWKRLKWEPEDIREFRSRIIANVALLNAFQERLACQTSLETKLGVDRLHERQDDRERREARQAILDWLTPIDYATQQSDFIGRRQEGTGQWLLDSNEFKTWMNQSNQVLFFSGIPGAGKTICASIVINELQCRFRNDASVGIAYIYCNFRRNQEQKAVNLLASLLKQFCQGLTFIPQSLRTLHEIHQSQRTRPSSVEISQTLQSVLSAYSKAFIIIDALDECQDSGGDRKQVLAGLFSLQAKTGLSLLATSRPIPNIKKEFEGRSTSVEVRASDYDLERYIGENIIRLPAFVLRSADLQKEVESSIIGAVDGMFLLAQLHLDSLIGTRSPKAIRNALAMLPKGSQAYDHAYSEAMMRIESQIAGSQQLAKQALSWIACAKRPLRSKELRYALAVEINESKFDVQNLTEIADVLNVCAGLVTIDDESSIVRLIHYTTQEYLERTWHSWFPNVQKDITETCLTYLSFDTFGSGFCINDEAFKARLRSNPLYDYAARNWGHHARAASTEVTQLVLDFLGKEAMFSSSVQVISSTEHRYSDYGGYRQKPPKHLTGVHVAAYFGLTDVMAILLDNGFQLDCKDSWSRTPLLWAAMNGKSTMVKSLVERAEIEVNSKDRYGMTPLAWSAWNGHSVVVKSLCERADIETNSEDQYGRTPLSLAAKNGHEAVVNVLVEQADINTISEDENGWTPLSWAARNGHEAVVKLLVKKSDVEVNLKDHVGRTPLSCAAVNGHEGVVKVLVDMTDIDMDSKDQYGRTPLLLAARNGHEEVVKALVVRADIDANSKDQDGMTSLSWAAKNGHEAVVKLLLDRTDVKADSRDQNGRTPLSWAAENGKKAVVKLLVERADIEVNHEDALGQTPLSWAARNGREAVVKFLVEQASVKTDYKARAGQTPLSWAAKNGHEAVVKLLVDRTDVVADSKDYNGQTPLSWAARNAHKEVIRLLLDRTDVDADSKDRNGRNPLSWAAQNGHEALVKLLLDRADVEADSRDQNGWTPLSWAAESGKQAVVPLLVERADIDADSRDQHGRTPLSRAAENGHEAVVKILMYRADVDAESNDENGQTPLLWAAKSGHDAVVKLLINRTQHSKNQHGRAALLLAAKNGHEAVVKLLVGQPKIEADFKDPGGRTPLSWTAEYGYEAVVNFLINRNDVDADSKDLNGRTPLSFAAENGHETVFKLLVDRTDVEADSMDQNGRTPLSWAAQNGHETVLKLLIDRTDVDADSKDHNGRTPLSWAAHNGHEALIQLLVDRPRVDADAKDQNGRTPLSWAAESGCKAAVRLLMERADVDTYSRDRDDRTPLSWATERGWKAVVRLFVERATVNVNTRD